MKKAREEGVASMPKQRPRSIPSLQVTLEEGSKGRRRPSKRNKDEDDDYEELMRELWDRGRASMRRLVYQSVQKAEEDPKDRIAGWKRKEISKSSPLLDVSMVTKANVALQRSPRKRPELPGIRRGGDEESSSDEEEDEDEDEEGKVVKKSHGGMKLDIGKVEERRLKGTVADQAGRRGDSSPSSDEEDVRERGLKTSRRRHEMVTKSYSMYHSSLLQQQQRLNGLLSPRLPRKSDQTMMEGCQDKNDKEDQQNQYLPLYRQSRDWMKQSKQANIKRSNEWKLHQASDYSLFIEFANYKQLVLSTRVMETRPTEKDKEIERKLAVLDCEASTRSTSPPSTSRHETTQAEGAPKRRAKEEVGAKPQQPTRGRLLSTSSDPTMDRTIAALSCTPLKTSDTSVQTQKSSEKGEKHASLSLQAVLRKEGLRLEQETNQTVRWVQRKLMWNIALMLRSFKQSAEEHRSVIGDDWKRGLVIHTKGGKEKIIGGDARRLMSHLADCTVQDRQFVDDFLCSFRTFLQPSELLEFLIGRYNMPPLPKPSGSPDLFLSGEDSCTLEDALYRRYRPLIQLRVLNVIRKWLANHFYDFDEDARLLARLYHFIENTLRVNQPNEQHYEALKYLLLEQASDILVSKQSPLAEIVVVMQREDVGINTEIFQKKGKVFVRSFNGMDFVDWCRTKLGTDSTAEAIELGDSMIKQGLIRTLEKRNRKKEFKVSANHYYRFTRAGRLAFRPPLPRIPSRLPPTDKLGLMDIDAIELARQFTLYSESLYRQVTPTRLVEYMQSDRKMAITSSFLNIFNFLNRWNEVAKWTTREVLSYSVTSHRADVLRKLIILAKACCGYNNFYDMSAILCGLNHSSISRLKKTWKLVNKKERKVFDELSALISPDNSYKLFRELQRDAWSESFNKANGQPAASSHQDESFPHFDEERRASSSGEVYGLIPYIAIYIIDLEHLSQVPETLADGSVNFSKKRVEASIFSEMIRFKEQRYNFVPIEPYRQWIENVPSRGFAIFGAPSDDATNGAPQRKTSKPIRRSSRRLPISLSLDNISDSAIRRRKVPRYGHSRETVAYDDKTLWEVSQRLEPSDRS